MHVIQKSPYEYNDNRRVIRLEYIQNNLFQIIVVAIVAIAFIVWLAWQIKKKGLRQTIIDFIVEAESICNSDGGKAKKKYVIDKIYILLPSILRIFISEETIDKLVQEIFDQIKEALHYKSENNI